MSLRAVFIGLLLGLGISLAAYFNDWVILQTQLIGNHLPVSVFGAAILLLLVVNPILNRLGRGFSLSGSEIAIIVAIGLASCGWPGSNFYRKFATALAFPSHWLKTKPSWQSTQIMSYVPGGSAEVAVGHVQDWPGLVRAIANEKESLKPSPPQRIWLLMDSTTRHVLREAAAQDTFELGRAGALTRGLNKVLADRSFYDPIAFAGIELPSDVARLIERRAALDQEDVIKLNRALLVASMPQVVLPPPKGHGVLLAGGKADPLAVDTLVQGRGRDNRLSLSQLPWATWWPTLRLWGSLALLLAAAALCLALIVHPQWSKRELLPYPIVRFIHETVERREGSVLPEVMKSRLFWVAFVPVLLLHALNGLHAWFPDVPEIPRTFDFNAMRTLFPNAGRIWHASAYFSPTIYLSVIAFCFFMTTPVSFSLGMSHMLYLTLAALLMTYGATIDEQIDGVGKPEMLRFGAYIGVFAMIVYTGRRYYANVLKGALGRPRADDTPLYSVWAMRALLVVFVLAVATLRMGGLDTMMALFFVLLACVIFVVLTRLVTETGNFYVAEGFLPVGVLTGLFGFEAIGPTTYLVLGVASSLLLVDAREALMPFLANALKMAEGSANTKPSRIAPWLLTMIVLGLFAAGSVTFYLQYNYGAIVADPFASRAVPELTFDPLSRLVSEATAHGTLPQATAATGFGRFALVNPSDQGLVWMLVGGVLVLGTAIARLRLPWWPLHPVAFLVWGTWPIIVFAFSFLLGWITKALVVGSAGARGYHRIKPLMVGIIAGEVFAALAWMLVGATYFAITGQRPVAYSVFPG
jgi:hypothetical protein